MRKENLKISGILLGFCLTCLAFDCVFIQTPSNPVDGTRVLPSAASATQTDLSTANASFQGVSGWDRVGWSVASVGDLNKDGYDDFVIGNPGSNLNTGAVYIIFGKTGLWWSTCFLWGGGDVTLTGEHMGDEAGGSVAGLGDVNGDGYDDFAISATNNETGTWAGKIYIIFGRPTAAWPTTMTLSLANASYRGEHAYDFAGGVAGAGDVNGDNFNDVIISSVNNTDGGFDGTFGAGKVYLILGRAMNLWANNVSLAQANASFWGDAAGDTLGLVSGAGDVNNDGLKDFMIATPERDYLGTENGMIYVLFGRPFTLWQKNVLVGLAANASYYGEHNSVYAGSSLAAAGDVDGNGCDDILIGASNENLVSNAATGKAYLIRGQSSLSFWKTNVNLSTVVDSFVGEAQFDQAGHRVAGSGDMNGDGYADFLISAIGSCPFGRSDAGQVYLLYGGPGKTWGQGILLREANASFVGITAGDYVGRSLAMGGDFNGDGLDDCLIGSPDAGTHGVVYLLFGSRIVTSTNPETENEFPTLTDILLIVVGCVASVSLVLNVVTLRKIRRGFPAGGPKEPIKR